MSIGLHSRGEQCPTTYCLRTPWLHRVRFIARHLCYAVKDIRQRAVSVQHRSWDLSIKTLRVQPLNPQKQLELAYLLSLSILSIILINSLLSK